MKKLLIGIGGIVIFGVAAWCVFHFVVPNLHIGGNGSGTENTTNAGVPASESTQPDSAQSDSPQPKPSEDEKIIEIRIEWNDIYFDNERCANEDELKEKITELGTTREYHFVHDNATQGTYDKVKDVLDELANVLGIIVHDGEHNK